MRRQTSLSKQPVQRLSRQRWVTLAVLLLSLCGKAWAQTVEAPVPLYTPPLLVPTETAGSGVAPEAKVRVHLNPRGVVHRVEVVSIEPSSAHDGLFEEALIQTLSEWRYAPQRNDGVAEATVLEWVVRFPEREESTPDWVLVNGLPGANAESLRGRVLALPLEERVALLEAQAAAANALILGNDKAQASTAHFVVHTDAGVAVATTIANNLEAIFAALASDFLGELDLLTEAYKVQVFAYRYRETYQTFIRDMPMFEWSAGFYSPAGLIALHLDQPTNEAVLSLLLHEATHAFMDRHVVRSGVSLPRWLGEGFADYVGNSKIKKGKLQPGKVRSGAFEMHRGRITRVTTGGAVSLEQAKRALRRGEGLGAWELLEASPDTFYGDRRSLFYDSAWLFVHFLLEGAPEWNEEQFPTMLLYLAEGYPPAEAFQQVYGDIGAADEAFREYVKKF